MYEIYIDYSNKWDYTATYHLAQELEHMAYQRFEEAERESDPKERAYLVERAEAHAENAVTFYRIARNVAKSGNYNQAA